MFCKIEPLFTNTFSNKVRNATSTSLKIVLLVVNLQQFIYQRFESIIPGIYVNLSPES